MKIKVCGMRNPSNIKELVELHPDYIGFIFYPKSKRFVGEQISEDILSLIPVYIQKVGVFVNEPFDSLLEKFKSNRLDMAQLHGSEIPGYCKRLKMLGIPLIKVFSISNNFDFELVKPYDPYCDFYLFDTAGVLPGGSGLKFDWEKLEQYTGEKPFFLSGGIKPIDAESIKQLSHNELYAIDVNSGFELEPGLKDIPKLKAFMEEVLDED
jgi:phosphoribosylanthranilate isomerase